jgi:hypothetical protein
MLARTTSYLGRPNFVVDEQSVINDAGRQIDWANVDNAYIDAATGKKVLPAGTVVGELLSGNGQISPRVDTTNPAIGLLKTDAIEDHPAHSVTGYGVLRGGHFFENLLPDASGSPLELDAAVKTELLAAGGWWMWTQYVDSR